MKQYQKNQSNLISSGLKSGSRIAQTSIKTLKNNTEYQIALVLILTMFVLLGAFTNSMHAKTAKEIFPNTKTAQELGFAITQEVEARDEGWHDYTVDYQMILRNRQGQESSRSVRGRYLEVLSDSDKIINIFDTPRDVRGTAFLSHAHKDKDDDQWLYLPALKRVKRIASANKSGPYMGSEFAYEDISGQEPEKYTNTYIKEETIRGIPCFVIEQDPVSKYSGYSKQVIWVDKDRFIVLKVEYYDRKNSHFKTLVMTDYKQFINKYWRAHKYLMTNHETGKSTDLIFSNYQFQTGLNTTMFNSNALKRLR